jgi:hypothetical protein
MARRIRIPLLLDVVLVDDPREMVELNRAPEISRVISGSGGLLHRAIHRRIYGTMRVDAEPLSVFADRRSGARANRQATLEKSLATVNARAIAFDADVQRLAQYVATGAADVPYAESVQQFVGRLFRPDFRATPATYAAARVVSEWPRANPVKALWWRCSGKLARSRELLWNEGGADPACIHAITIAFHNIVAAVERLRAAARDGTAVTRPAHEVVRTCLVAPSTLLRSAIGPVRVGSLKRPLRNGTLVVFKLDAMHTRTHDSGLAFAEGEWNECPAHAMVPRLLEAIWMTAMTQHR